MAVVTLLVVMVREAEGSGGRLLARPAHLQFAVSPPAPARALPAATPILGVNK